MKMYNNIPYKIFYDIEKYPFQKIICEILEVDDLEKLHEIQFYEILTREKDQSTIWHKKFYDNFKNYFEVLYLKLVDEIKSDYGYEKIIYQKIPSFRVQLGNGNLAVGKWHRDREFGHGVSEINFWLPVVNTNEFNSVYTESKENKRDFRPYTVNYGEIFIFDGANLQHGNVPNESNKTRVSIDFRLVDPKKFQSSQNGSINMNTKFEIGGYFEIM